jgi:hypothetical protein
MTKKTKVLLAISLTAFLFGSTGMLWGFGTPVGAIFFGLFLISKLLEKEDALFDEEHSLRMAAVEMKSPQVPAHIQRLSPNATLEAPLGVAAHSH